MCGRYTVLTEDEIIEIREILKKLTLRIARDDFDDYDERPGEVFPTNVAPVITKNIEGVFFQRAKWGFKKWDGQGVIINARSESLRTKKTFSPHLEMGRCVVPAGEFFEWEKLKSGKRKYYAVDRNGNLLFMAGLYRDQRDEGTGSIIREFVIITKESTGEMARVHGRMPVILPVEKIEAWLTGKLTPEDVEKMEYDVLVAPVDDGDKNNRGQISLF